MRTEAVKLKGMGKEKEKSFYKLFQETRPYFFSSKKRIAILLIVITFSTFLALLLPWPFALLVDTFAVDSRDPNSLYRYAEYLLPEKGMNRILVLAVGYFVLKILHDLLVAVKTVVNTSIDQSIIAKVRSEFFAKLQSLHLDHHKKFPRGETLYRLNNDTLGFQQLFNMFVSLVVALVTVTVMVIIMYQTNAYLTLACLPAIPLLMMLNNFTETRLYRSSVDAKQADSEYSHFIHQALTSIGLAQLFVQESREYEEFQEGNYTSLRAWFKVHGQLSLYRWGVGIIYAMATAIIIYIGGKLAYENSSVSMGELSIFMMYLASVYEPLCTITGAKAQIKTGLIGIQRVQDILKLDPIIKDSPDAIPLTVEPRDIIFRNVGFKYGEKVALQDINLEIKKNELVVIVGESGAGKSTLLHFFPRFYDPGSGEIFLDVNNMKDIRLKDLRSHVAMVLQDTVLLPTTVSENITYGKPQASMEDVVEAATLSGAHEFIESLSLGYKTPLDQDAHILSGGQKQRIAIARALVTKSPILVFDEPTSALDTRNENHFNETLKKLKGHRTLIVVTHRLACAPLADRIIVMKSGRVVGEGKHEELLKSNIHYQEIQQHQ